MVHQHYGTQTVNRGAVMPGMLVKHKDGTGLHQLIYADGFICIAASSALIPVTLLVEVFLDGRGNGLNH